MTIPRGYIPGKAVYIDDVLDGTTSFTQLNADNLCLDGNTISSTDTNGDINILSNGSGNVSISNGSTTTLLMLRGCAFSTVGLRLMDDIGTRVKYEYSDSTGDLTASNTMGKFKILSGSSDDIELTPSGNVNITANSFEMAGIEFVNTSRNVSANQVAFDSGMTISNNTLACSSALQITRAGQHPSIEFTSDGVNRDLSFYMIDGAVNRVLWQWSESATNMTLKNLTSNDSFNMPDSGGWAFNDGSSDVLTINSDGSISPPTIADASAANNTIYYSSDQSKLVYKDSGGTVNVLY